MGDDKIKLIEPEDTPFYRMISSDDFAERDWTKDAIRDDPPSEAEMREVFALWAKYER